MSTPPVYTLNGINLEANTYGWTLQDKSSPLPGITKRTSELVDGSDGNTPVYSPESSPVITLVEKVPYASSETFLALCDSATLVLGFGTYVASVELLNVTISDMDADFIYYGVVLRFYGMFWRDPSVSTSTAATLTTDTQVVSVLSSISAPVRDAIVRVKGALTALVVTDTRGSSFAYAPALPSTSYLRFEASTGKAFITTSNVWVGGTEVTGSIVDGPGPYPLSLTPAFTDPATRAASLTVQSTTRSASPTIEVRAAGAYRV